MAAYSTYTDNELVELIKTDNQHAFTEIYNRFWDKLLAVALNRLENLEEAEECVHDVFLKLWRLRQKLELKYSLSTYLAAAIRYRSYDLMAGQYRKQRQATQDLAGVNTDIADAHLADAHLLEQELMDMIAQSVRQLPDKCRVVYQMSREQGLSNKQIAAELNVSEKAVEAHLSRAFKGIKSNLALAGPIALWLIGQ